MKTTLAILAILFAGIADSAPLNPRLIANMQAQSDWSMDKGACAVANDKTDHGNRMMAVKLKGEKAVRQFSLNIYNEMRMLNYSKNANGQWEMTAWIGKWCSADGTSDQCLAARSFWKQEPLDVLLPGQGVKIMLSPRSN